MSRRASLDWVIDELSTILLINSFDLVSEQFNVYRILFRYDRKNRHRKIKKQRRYERLIVTNQFVYFRILNEREQLVSKSRKICIFASV